jgi:hypothetical protein
MSEPGGNAKSPTRVVAQNMSELAHDVVTLIELQTQLVKEELSGWTRSMVTPLVLLVIGVVLGLSCLPIALLCLAHVLVEFAGLSQATSLLITVLIGYLVAVAVAALGVYRLRRSLHPLQRSREEFTRNISWIKRVLKHKQNPATTSSGSPNRQF